MSSWLRCVGNGQAISEPCQSIAGLIELLVELAAAPQHLGHLLQLHLHLVAVLCIHHVHVLLHLVAYLNHLHR